MKLQQAQMPFPNNNNPETDFNARWPNLPPAGIMNDLRPQVPPGPQVPENMALILKLLRGN